MSENTVPYPFYCEGLGCAQLLYGPVAYCPYCGAGHSAQAAQTESLQTVPAITPGPKPFVIKTPRPPEAGENKIDTPPKFPAAPHIQRPPAQTGSGQEGTDHAMVSAAKPDKAHADIEPPVPPSPQSPPTTTTSAQVSHEPSATQEPAKGKNHGNGMPGWTKFLVTVAALLVAWLVFRPGDDKALMAEFKEAKEFIARKDLSAARQGLEHVLTKKPGHLEAARLLEEIKLRQQKLGKSLDQAEQLVNQGAAAKAKTMAQAVLAEDSGSSRARDLLAHINQQSEMRGTCTTTANLAFAAIKAQNLESARELLGSSRASNCPEAERIEKALTRAEVSDSPATPAQLNSGQDEGRTTGTPGDSRVDRSMALSELDKAMRLVTEGNWKMGREKAESVRALSGNDSTIQSAVARVLRAADQERAVQTKAIVIQ